ncbi:MAG: hypothetical protein SVC26_04920 [Pseudomonadota bacterium]|nr:hypothetical protein [Pseudomonadota bacterium]
MSNHFLFLTLVFALTGVPLFMELVKQSGASWFIFHLAMLAVIVLAFIARSPSDDV